ncbi:hypothetical protein GJAV_G00131010 [Gymnothorax javanicus]|nr:hypothetical protein GJAV_G00131010 [Gymnothorax javanicus]
MELIMTAPTRKGKIVTFTAMDCTENEYYYKGECHLCQQCEPGQELSEECGYGSGRGSFCVSCQGRYYKEKRGHHSCTLCQSCKLVNRLEKFPCTAKSNAICGECLPGFYSKTRIDGLHDLECMPCGPSLVNERQCIRSRGEGEQTVWSTEAPPLGGATACFTAGALVVIAVVATVVYLVCCRRTSLRKIFEACTESKKCSPSKQNQAAVTALIGETVILNIEKEVLVSSPCEDLKTVDLPTSLRAPTFPVPISTTSELRNCTRSNCSEAQPLLRCSTCSNCFLGCVSHRTSSSANSGECLMERCSIPLHEVDLYCASAQEDKSQHAPVECTELDFHSFFVPDDQTTSLESKASVEGTEDPNQSRPVELLNDPSVCSLQSTNSCLNGSQQLCGSACCNTWSSVLGLMKKSCSLLEGVHLGRLPQCLIESLALKLNPVIPGVKNYQQVALELGVPVEVLQSLQGFEHVFQYLRSCTLLTVPDLLNTLHRLQRFDAVLLLCEYASKSQLTTHACKLPRE